MGRPSCAICRTRTTSGRPSLASDAVLGSEPIPEERRGSPPSGPSPFTLQGAAGSDRHARFHHPLRLFDYCVSACPSIGSP